MYVYLEYLTKFYLTKSQNYHWDEKILINKIQIICVLDILDWINLLSKILVDSSGLELKVTDPGCYRLQYFKDTVFFFFYKVVVW